MSQKSKFVSSLLSSALILSQLTSPMSALASSARARRVVKTKPDTITGTLQGRVIDPGELPLADVRVRVINEETGNVRATRSEEHTSELQSLRHLVCRLLLEKKK